MIPLQNANFLVVGLARNCGRQIVGEVEIINRAFAASNNTKWLIIESDSDDDTLGRIEFLKSRLDLNCISLGRLCDRFPKRTERIASCRNAYVKEIRENKTYANIDYVVVADLDGVNSQLTSSAVQTCWQLGSEWDACFANQSAPYYDIWALRQPSWNPIDCFRQETFFRNAGLDEFQCRYLSVISKMIRIPPASDPIKVQSAFGGLGIYRREFFSEGSYLGIDENGFEVCEHVHFHTCRKTNSNLLIVPSLVNGGWNRHSRYSKSAYLIGLYMGTRFMSFDRLGKLWRTFAKR
jgi:hypothetical protein